MGPVAGVRMKRVVAFTVGGSRGVKSVHVKWGIGAFLHICLLLAAAALLRGGQSPTLLGAHSGESHNGLQPVGRLVSVRRGFRAGGDGWRGWNGSWRKTFGPSSRTVTPVTFLLENVLAQLGRKKILLGRTSWWKMGWFGSKPWRNIYMWGWGNITARRGRWVIYWNSSCFLCRTFRWL